ncbi:YolD-like family protein [Metabacillus malikii]|uniref:YolD-like family protein n=1 Tax=Metabacillus malikii TaxID=1504265 RepID=A0ABT9ZPV6_9BACI|nr:YolD-like family protein [Metabacillus malikii]MDQ0233270.1 hypothetical protein [Metabacillus malikii]
MNDNQRFQVMFVLRMPSDISMLLVTGVDFHNGCLFTVVLHSPQDSIQLDYNTAHYPNDLIEHLHSEKERIDSGYYDVRTWKMELFNQELKELKEMTIKDRNMKKWAPFKSLPQQWEAVSNVFEAENKMEKPILDEYEMEAINDSLRSSLEQNQPLKFKLYNKGYMVSVPGIVSKIDPFNKQIQIIGSDGNVMYIKFHAIVGVEYL